MENNQTKVSEKKIQAKVWKLIDNRYPQFRGMVWHTANEMYVEKRDGETEKDYQKRYMIILSQLKALGVVAGVPDIIIRYRGVMYWIELKIEGGRILEAQKIFHDRMKQDFGVVLGCVIWRNHEEEAIRFCNWILNNGLEIKLPDNFVPYE